MQRLCEVFLFQFEKREEGFFCLNLGFYDC